MLLAATACRFESARPEPASTPATRVLVGAEVLARDGFQALSGLRVGLIVNHTSTVESTHLADTLLAAGIDVRALFGPEHGVRGDAGAGVAIESGRDEQTGLPVYSLYGPTRSPEPEALAELDALVFDIQDVGARFYTYISTMGLAMQAAAEAGIPFFVLDRPNPLGGNYVSGFVLDAGEESFVGLYPIPVAHGLTVGELARMIRGESWLSGLDALDLRVVEMDGWRRELQWPDLGRQWVPTSPNIPDFPTAAVYPGMCYLEATTVSEGRGTEHPFLQFGAPWIDATSLAAELNAELNAENVVGAFEVSFEAVTFTPRSLPNAAPNPRYRDTEIPGVRIALDADAHVGDSNAHVGDSNARVGDSNAHVDALRLGMVVLTALRDHAAARGEPNLIRQASMRRLAGTTELYGLLVSGASADEIAAEWADEVASFRTLRVPYLLYSE